jgi:hypothetical protein
MIQPSKAQEQYTSLPAVPDNFITTQKHCYCLNVSLGFLRKAKVRIINLGGGLTG